jgi:hypothetical protein
LTIIRLRMDLSSNVLDIGPDARLADSRGHW